MKKEAIKIVKAKLNEALNKNDSVAVREACIVLKAMEDMPFEQIKGDQWMKIKDIVKNNIKQNEDGSQGYDDEKIKVEVKNILPGYVTDDEIKYWIDTAKGAVESGRSL